MGCDFVFGIHSVGVFEVGFLFSLKTSTGCAPEELARFWTEGPESRDHTTIPVVSIPCRNPSKGPAEGVLWGGWNQHNFP